jgi:hypothetical protein
MEILGTIVNSQEKCEKQGRKIGNISFCQVETSQKTVQPVAKN